MAHPQMFDDDDPYLERVRQVADDGTDWDEVTELLDASYRLTAPKRLVAELDRAD